MNGAFRKYGFNVVKADFRAGRPYMATVYYQPWLCASDACACPIEALAEACEEWLRCYAGADAGDRHWAHTVSGVLQ